jgi:hypothetical protein
MSGKGMIFKRCGCRDDPRGAEAPRLHRIGAVTRDLARYRVTGDPRTRQQVLRPISPGVS